MSVSRYKVAFDVNGSIMTVDAQMVKLGNQYLHCKDTMQGDEIETVAMLPFDSVEYIVHQSVTISADALESGADVDVELMDGGTTQE